jgi:hypothetical protein
MACLYMQVMEAVAMVKSLSQSAAALTTASTLTTEAAAAANSAMHDARRLASVFVDLGTPGADELLSQIAAPLVPLAAPPPVPSAEAAHAALMPSDNRATREELLQVLAAVNALDEKVTRMWEDMVKMMEMMQKNLDRASAPLGR